MRFYNQQHRFYCGVDLHARTMYLSILDQAGQVVYDKNLAAEPDAFLQAIAPFRDGLVVAVECLFCWYWLADLCAREHIAFVLGHALYMKAIHGGKAKTDQIDAHKIAVLFKGGMLSQAYPKSGRAPWAWGGCGTVSPEPHAGAGAPDPDAWMSPRHPLRYFEISGGRL